MHKAAIISYQLLAICNFACKKFDTPAHLLKCVLWSHPEPVEMQSCPEDLCRGGLATPLLCWFLPTLNAKLPLGEPQPPEPIILHSVGFIRTSPNKADPSPVFKDSPANHSVVPLCGTKSYWICKVLGCFKLRASLIWYIYTSWLISTNVGGCTMCWIEYILYLQKWFFTGGLSHPREPI